MTIAESLWSAERGRDAFFGPRMVYLAGRLSRISIIDSINNTNKNINTNRIWGQKTSLFTLLYSLYMAELLTGVALAPPTRWHDNINVSKIHIYFLKNTKKSWKITKGSEIYWSRTREFVPRTRPHRVSSTQNQSELEWPGNINQG